MKFRKKPVVVEAIEWTGTNVDEIVGYFGQYSSFRRTDGPGLDGGTFIGGYLLIETLEDGPNREAKHVASPGDWIIKGVKNEIYACKPDIFADTYEVVE